MTTKRNQFQNFYSVREAAALLRVSWQRLYQLLHAGQLERRHRWVVTGRSVERLLKIRKGRKP